MADAICPEPWRRSRISSGRKGVDYSRQKEQYVNGSNRERTRSSWNEWINVVNKWQNYKKWLIAVESGKVDWGQTVKNILSSNVEFRLYSIGIRVPLEVLKQSNNMIRFVLLEWF